MISPDIAAFRGGSISASFAGSRLPGKYLAVLMLWCGLVSFESWAVDVNQYPVLKTLVAKMAAEDGQSRQQVEAILSNAKIDPHVIDLMGRQWEARPWFEYRNRMISETRIAGGVRFWNRYQSLLAQVSDRYGVPVEIIVAILGIETNYGANMGKKRVLDSLTTLSAAYPRRSEYFTGQLRIFLNTVLKEGITPESVVGSYAGAIGIPQFMPGSYEAYAVDFNANNQRDLVNEFADAVASVANYLHVHGWNRGQKIFADIAGDLPAGLRQFVKPKPRLTLLRDDAAAQGLQFPVQGGSEKIGLVWITEEYGKRIFVAFNNFRVITRYNTSTNYAMAVTELASEIRQRRLAD